MSRFDQWVRSLLPWESASSSKGEEPKPVDVDNDLTMSEWERAQLQEQIMSARHKHALQIVVLGIVGAVVAVLTAVFTIWLLSEPADIKQAHAEGHAEGFEEGRREGYKSCKDADKSNLLRHFRFGVK